MATRKKAVAKAKSDVDPGPENTRSPPSAPQFKKPKWPSPAARKKELLASLADADAELEHRADALLLPCVNFALERVKGPLPVGSTRFGGLPDLPKGTTWPALDGNPLHFVGQWALSDLAGLEAASALPKDGLLSFFVLMFPRSDDQQHCGHGVVLHTPAGAALVRAELPADWSTPDDPRELFAECRVHFAGSWSLPHGMEALVGKALDAEERRRYAGEDGTVYSTQLLGWRQHNGYSVQPEALRLLMQLNSDDQLGAEFGDVEDCDWFVDASALAKGDFATVVMVGGA